ncbi:phosphotransferase family protein [Amycolatopsis alkalitolerans]|uniref:Phosphotransferase family protein n=2 Tax=Amycolatopsis alkalitolerans TaxID=2547244 RepID=A0A5C4LZC0_9PSEU|nr:phosphotransferase family protein [Amycolatopsis alkalitolerans]
MRLITGGRSNPTYVISAGDRSWVLRRPPYGFVLPTAHDMGREFRVLSALAGSKVPVPAVIGLCEDTSVIGAPFYVMERINGITLRTARETERITADERRALSEAIVDTLVTLHEVPIEAVGLSGWGRPRHYLARQLARWRRQWESSRTSPRPEVDELLTRLGRTLPVSTEFGIVHGDYKIDNLMVDPGARSRILAVLDWEMSTLGDTLADIGILASFWDDPGEPPNPITAGATALPGFLARHEVIELYAARRDVDPAAIDWYLVFADLKIAVILEGIHSRYLQGHAVGAAFETVGAMVGTLLDRAVRRSHRLGRRTGNGGS